MIYIYVLDILFCRGITIFEAQGIIMPNGTKTILLVEDELITAKTERRVLEQNGYKVVTVHSGEDAVSFAADHQDKHIDLILMDIDLGKGIDGTEAAKRILTNKEIPIVFLTSHAERQMVEKVKNITRYGYVLKNSGDFVLLSSVEMAFELFQTQRRSKENEEKYRLLAENSSELVTLFENESIKLISPAVEKILGYTPEEFLSFNHLDLIHPDDRDRIASTIKKRIEERNTDKITYRYRQKNKWGEYKWLESTVTEKVIKNSHVLTVLNTKDITEQKRIERLVERREHLFADILGRLYDAIYSVDAETFELLLTNDAIETIFGKPKETFYADSSLYIRMVHPDDISIAENSQREIFEKKEGEWIYRIIRPTGEIRWVLDKARLIENEHGRPDRIDCLFTDITDRRNIELELERSEKQYRELLESISDSVYVLDTEWRHLIVNEAAARFTGIPKEQLLGTALPELFPGIETTSFFRKFEEVLETGSPGVVVDHFLFADGRKGWFEVSVYPVPKGILCLSRDVTDRIKNEEKIHELIKEKDLLLREVHHRIKNNMTIISSILSLQAQTVENRAAENALVEAKNRIKSMLIIYDKLYRSGTYSNIDAKSYLHNLISDLAYTYSRQEIKIKEHLEPIRIDVRTVIPVGIIINELITNALKYAFPERGEGKIEIILKKSTEQSTRITIKDNGVGLPREIDIHRAKTFGFMLINSLVDQINGLIEVHRNNGTEFIIIV